MANAKSTLKKPAAKKPAAKKPAAKKPATKKPAKKPAKPTHGPKRPATLAQILGSARDAFAKGDLPATLTYLRSTWARKPDPVVADAIDAIGAKLGASLPPIVGKTPSERNAAWIAAAKTASPALVHHLLADLTETKGNAETLARIEVLLANHLDPRVSAKLADLVEVPIYNASVSRTNAFWKRVFALLPTLRDPRILARSRAWVATWKGNRELNAPERVILGRRLEKITGELEAAYGASNELHPDERAIVAAIAKGAAHVSAASVAAGDAEAALLAAVYANPDDDAPRAVYADWLQEKDDPRGEFIALQLAGDGGTKRANELRKLHGHRWLGALAKYVIKDELEFERGFIARARFNRFADHGKLTGVPADPMWSTVIEAFGEVPASDAHPMPALVFAHDVDTKVLEHLATCPRAVPRLATLAWTSNRMDDDAAAAAFARCKLPALRRLELWGSIDWIYPMGMAPEEVAWRWREAGVLELAVSAPPRRVPAWLAATEKSALVRLELINTDHWRGVGCSVTATRAPGTPWSTLALANYNDRYTLPEIVAALNQLPAASFDVTINDDHVPEIEAAVARLRKDRRAR